MENLIKIHTPITSDICEELNAGDMVLLSGSIITGRDTAHKRLFKLIAEGKDLPVKLDGETIFYAAPTPPRPGRITGSIGPTTSYRMDEFAPELMRSGLRGMIGKGSRSAGVKEAIMRYKAVYFGAMGGIAALMAGCIRKADVIAYEDLGPESMMRLEIEQFPLIVINDTRGGDLYEDAAGRCSMT
ncbi:MAG: FumA C-terminus/TtdB family hydratase beta subunit, partial [Thermodesulfobacteriota bacterium]|nr:FumA C-terminus/TtdB family hydratase beta subunit [Thermodesulfobacteriota bacterium]